MKYTKRQINEAIAYWKGLLGESRYFNEKGEGVCWLGGRWTDSTGRPVEITGRQADDIASDIGRMEYVTYRPLHMSMLGGASGMQDVFDYLDAESPDDCFVYFKGVDPAKSVVRPSSERTEGSSPATLDREYAGAFYMIASVQDIPGRPGEKALELADACGDAKTSTVGALRLLKTFMREKNVVAMYCNARRASSGSFLDGLSPKHLERFWGVREYPVYNDPDDEFPSRVFVDIKWADSMDPDELEELASELEYMF